jgi:hypothetical protein
MIRANRPTDEWEACPAGALQGLSQRLRSRRRIRTIRKCAAVVVVLMLGVSAVSFSLMPAKHGPLTCREIREKAGDYLAHRLSPAVDQEFREHIGHCAHCRDIVEAARQKLKASPPPQARMNHQPVDGWMVARTR